MAAINVRYTYDGQEFPASSSLSIPGKCKANFELSRVTSCPDIDTLVGRKNDVLDPGIRLVTTNPRNDVLFGPIMGPVQPHIAASGGIQKPLHNHLTGNLEPLHVRHNAFDSQYNLYRSRGVAADPSDFQPQPRKRVDTLDSAQQRGQTATTVSLGGRTDHVSLDSASVSRKRDNKKRLKCGGAESEEFMGPWAPFRSEIERKQRLEDVVGLQDTVAAADEHRSEPVPDEKPVITSIFHGQQEQNYLGRSWLDKPKDFRERDQESVNYIPKRHVHSFVGHTMAVFAVRMFPSTGHLLLSCSMDCNVKIWDCYNQRRCIRTYMGHEQGVRDIKFTNDGRNFYSCAYDRNINLWDTEYGKIIGRFTNGKTPFCVSVHPHDDQQHVFIVGSQNKKAVQFDAKSGQIVQEYNEHLGAVNTVTFCENGKRIVTTADDKKIFVWDYGIPVVVKHIAEPHMHSMPAVKLHPSEKFFAAQSMDNQIVVYEAVGRFRFQGTKRFKGHSNSGYAIEPGFSCDGRYIMSGDATGKLWFWDWKNLKNYRTLQCHDGVLMSAQWHPTMTSRVATCGWDGLIKLWE